MAMLFFFLLGPQLQNYFRFSASYIPASFLGVSFCINKFIETNLVMQKLANQTKWCSEML